MAFQAQRDDGKGEVELETRATLVGNSGAGRCANKISNIRTPGDMGYGEGPSVTANAQQSVRPGTRVVSQTGRNLETTVGDEVLAGVIAGRARGDQPMDNWQTRDASGLELQVPTAFGMKRQSDPSFLQRKSELPWRLDTSARGNAAEEAHQPPK